MGSGLISRMMMLAVAVFTRTRPSGSRTSDWRKATVSPSIVVPVMLWTTIMLLDSALSERVLPHPASAAMAAAAARTLRVEVILFMVRSLLLLDDPGREED